jgi:hypothetical protein
MGDDALIAADSEYDTGAVLPSTEVFDDPVFGLGGMKTIFQLKFHKAIHE